MSVEALREFGLLPIPYTNPPKHEPFWFEVTDLNETRYWARKFLPTGLYICGLYFLFVMFGPSYMKNRKPFNLQKPLILWNFSLAIFSICGFLRCAPEFFEVLLSEDGFYKSACTWTNLNQPFAFWGLAFTLSKIAELVDTVFIVLRKRPLSFLHWFHHMSMAWTTFYIFAEGEPLGRWGAILNFGVHSIMYSYYTIMSLKFKLPKKVAMVVTTIQILQFVVGLAVHFYTLSVQGQGGDCYRTENSKKTYIFLGTTYLFLFVRLFYNSYIAPTKNIKKE